MVVTEQVDTLRMCEPIVSDCCGLSTFGGSEDVGWATTRAVVISSPAVVFLDLIISVAVFVIFFAK